MPLDSPILVRLHRQGSFWRRRRVLTLTITALLVLAAPLLLLALIDTLWSLRESTAATCTWLAAGAATLYWIGGWLRLRAHQPDARTVALAVETDKPEYMDSLACAVELLELPPEQRRSPLHQALLAKVSSELDTAAIHAAVQRRVTGARPLAGLALAAVAMLAAVLAMPFADKAYSQTRDLIAGDPTGLTVQPGHIEIAAGDDLTIEAAIHRGPVAAVLQMTDDRGTEHYDLYPDTGSTLSIDLYAVDRDFTYRIITPTLRSRQYEVTTFRRPELDSIMIEITPPAYTGLEPSRTQQLTDLTAPVGSEIHLRFTANMAVRADLQPKNSQPLRFQSAGSRHTYALRFPLERSMEYRLSLDDRRGHIVQVPGIFRLDAIADAPPVVQVLSPDDDAVYDTDETIPFAIDAADDYALGSIHLFYSINGGDFQEVVLYQAAEGERLAEQSASHGLALEGLVEHGDVIYYYGAARDNREPEAQEGRSDIRFIEIRPKKADDDEDSASAEMEGGQAQQATLSVSDLIMAQKALIRQSWRYLHTKDPNQQARLLQELMIAGADQELNASKRYNDLKERIPMVEMSKLGALFESAINGMQSAKTMLQNENVESSLPFQQSALSKLIQLEIELLKNAQQQQQQGQGQQSQQQAQRQENQQQQQQDQEQQRQEQIAGMQESLQQLRDLRQRQENLNTGMKENSREGKFQPGSREGAINEQRDILAETWDVHNELTQMREAHDVMQELSKATQQMTATRQSIGLNRADRAVKQGQLAEEFLQRSEEMLDNLIQDLSGNELKMVERELQQLRERQERVRQETERAARNEQGAPSPEQLGEAQKALRDNYQQIMDKVGETASELETQNPIAARTLEDAMQQARQANIDGKMKRAENALSYQRPERSVDYQQEVEAALGQLAKRLGEAQQQTGGPGKEQLTRMLQQTLEDLAAMQQLAERRASLDEMQQQAEAMKQNLREMAEATQDGRMDHLANQMNSIGKSGSFAHSDVQSTMNLSAQAARLLELKIMEKELAQRVEFSRLAGRQPPEEYRKLVNEYFKKLSEEY